jgi:hypothetical protein
VRVGEILKKAGRQAGQAKPAGLPGRWWYMLRRTDESTTTTQISREGVVSCYVGEGEKEESQAASSAVVVPFIIITFIAARPPARSLARPRHHPLPYLRSPLCSRWLLLPLSLSGLPPFPSSSSSSASDPLISGLAPPPRSP